MTLAELLARFSFESEDEMQDGFDQEIFEIKQFLLQKPVLFLTSKSRVKRLNELSLIANYFGLNNENIHSIPFTLSSDLFSLTDLNAYLNWKAQWKTAVSSAISPNEIIARITESFATDLIVGNHLAKYQWMGDIPVIGQEPDPMLVRSFIQEATKNNWLTVKDWNKNQKLLDSAYILLLKRLSLLHNYVKNE